MANPEHVAALKRGIEFWRGWRRPNIAVDLSRANLHDLILSGYNLAHVDLSFAELHDATLVGTSLGGANLANANMRFGNLRRADLRWANLRGANLASANLIGAELQEADLGVAKLRGANLSGANLTGVTAALVDFQGATFQGTLLRNADFREANLVGSSLEGANFIAANVSGANFREAMLSRTVFVDMDLSVCRGLKGCRHGGPSAVDFLTLNRSHPLPLSFLRGIGLSDMVIEYLPSLLTRAIQLYSCFISYSAVDADFARRLHADLQDNGVRCWFAPEDMKIGAKILDTLDQAIRLRDKVVLVLSEASIASDWVEDEVTKAFAEERQRNDTILMPVRIDDSVFDTGEAWAVKLRDNRNIGDFRAWKQHDGYKKALDRLLRDLKIEVLR